MPNTHWQDDGTGDYNGKWLYDKDNSEPIYLRWIDPAEFGHNVSGSLKVGNLLAGDHGLSVIPANNNVEVGIEMVKRYLQTGYDDEPRLQVFSTCTNWLKERAKYRRRSPNTFGRENSERRASPVKKHDHLMDATRYVIAGGVRQEIQVEQGELDDYSCPVVQGEATSVAEARVQESWKNLMQRMKQGPSLPKNTYLGNQY